MRAQRACRFTLLLTLLLRAGLAAGPAAANDQSSAQNPFAAIAAEATARSRPSIDEAHSAAEKTAPVAAAPAPGAVAPTSQALAKDNSPLTKRVSAQTAMRQPEPGTAAGHHGVNAATEELARPGVPGEAPEMTGSLPKNTMESHAVGPAATAALEPNQVPDPFFQTAAPATPPAPAAAAPVTPFGPEGSGASGTPAAAAPAAPSFADRLHAALDAYVAKEPKGRDAAEMHMVRDAIAAFYAARNYAPLWVENGKPNEAARSVLARLAHARDDGLSVDDLPAPVFGEGDGHESGDDKLIAADINLTVQVVAYGREASGSRIEPHRIAALIGAKPKVPEPAQILAPIAAAGANAGTMLEGFNPPQAGYRALRDKLAELRRETRPVALRAIPAGPALKVGMSDPRVPLIRARFGLDAEPTAAQGDLLYDTRVAAAVAEFQKAYGLPASGVLTAPTIAALSGGQPSRLEDELLANMEIWRWMPRDMGKDRIEVNIPDFTVNVFRADQPIWRNKVIVGKPQTPTPVFSNMMRFLIVNPYWNVPPSILRKEMLPHLAQDPAYLSRMGYEVFTRHGHLVVRQPPGEQNALGRIKFMFPNDYSVYLHDTPSRDLFGAARRAYSHGCVRVDQPFGFAQAVLGPGSGWSEQRVKHLIGGGQRFVNLPKPLPIHLEYFTAFVDADGHLQLRDDIYGYARKVDVALGLEK